MVPTANHKSARWINRQIVSIITLTNPSAKSSSGDAPVSGVGAPKITDLMIRAGTYVLRESGRLSHEMEGVDEVLVERILAASLRRSIGY